jgi:cytochrome c-type biogenesis protein CcmH
MKRQLGALVVTLFALGLAAQTTTLKVPDAENFVGAPQGTPLAGAPLDARTREVGGLLRCPVCQGMSIADSPSEMAVNMKAQVHELLARGYTEEQILHYFELSYGQFVLLRPKSMIVWLLPVLALLVGAAVLVLTFRRLSRAPVHSAAITIAPDAAVAEDPYLSRVRDLVSGDKS